MENQDDLFSQILSHGPSQGTLFMVLTKLKEEGNLSETIHECLRSLSFYPDDIRLRKLLAESYTEIGSVDKAEIELNKVTSIIDDLSSAYKLLGTILSQQQRSEEAVEALKIYLAHKPEDKESQDLIEKIISADEETVSEPLEPSEEISELVGEEEFISEELATPTLAEIYFNQGQINEAISTYEEVILSNPKNAVAIKRLAELRGMIIEDTEEQLKEEDTSMVKREKMIPVLEGWLARIQELKNV